MAIVYIGIGSNLGNRKKNCISAIELLKARGIRTLKVSSFYETEPWGVKEQPSFINIAVEAETEQKPSNLLKTLKSIEIEMGRHETIKWGPRIIDLDILFYDDLIINEPDLIIPHPYIADRLFVLKPMAEIAPELVHPVEKKSIKELLNIHALKAGGKS